MEVLFSCLITHSILHKNITNTKNNNLWFMLDKVNSDETFKYVFLWNNLTFHTYVI